MKLKTLKDIVPIDKIDSRTSGKTGMGLLTVKIHTDLKKEAIKWIKRHQKMAMDTRLVEIWISHFFNIRKEDLK